jgi:hypothetical protein
MFGVEAVAPVSEPLFSVIHFKPLFKSAVVAFAQSLLVTVGESLHRR